MANDFYYNGTSLTDIKYNGTTVNVVKYNDVAVWGRQYTYSTGTLPTGVASITCTRATSPNAHASTGTVANGGAIYYGDTIYFTATAATYYNNPTSSKTSSSPLTVTGNATGASYITAGSRKTVSIVLNKNSNVSSISLTYINASGTSTTVTAAGTYTAQQGTSYSWSATAATYYQMSSSSGSGTTGTSTLTISPTATRKTNTITFTKNTNVQSITIQYVDSSGNTQSQTWTSSKSVTVQQGTSYSYTTKPDTYYSASPASGSGTITSNLSISPTASRKTCTISFTKNANINSITLKYVNTSGSSITSTLSTSTSVTAQQGTAYSWTATPATYYTADPASGSGNTSTNSSISIAPTAYRTICTITFAKGGGNYGSWNSAYIIAYAGDTISRSGNTVTVYKYDASSTARGSSTFTNGSETPYNYTVSYSSLTSPITADQTVTATTSRSVKTYTLSISQGSNSACWVTRSSSPYGGGSTGLSNLSNGTTLYYGDQLDVLMKPTSLNEYKLTTYTVTMGGSTQSMSVTYQDYNRSWGTWQESDTNYTGCIYYASRSISSVTGNVSATSGVTAKSWQGPTSFTEFSTIGINSGTSYITCTDDYIANQSHFPYDHVQITGKMYLQSTSSDNKTMLMTGGDSGNITLKYALISGTARATTSDGRLTVAVSDKAGSYKFWFTAQSAKLKK